MNKNVRKVLSLALVFVMVFASLANVGLAFNNTSYVKPADLVNEYYGKDTGFMSAKADGCEEIYSIRAKVQDSRGNLLGYKLVDKKISEVPQLVDLLDQLELTDKPYYDSIVNNIIKVREALGYSVRLVRIGDGDEETVLVDDVFINEYGIATFQLPLDDDGNPVKFAQGQYRIDYTEDGETWEKGPLFTITCDGISGDLVVTVPAKEWCYAIKVTNENFRPAADVEISLHKLQTVKSGNDFKYVLDSNKLYQIEGNALAVRTTNADGYAGAFTLARQLDDDGNQVVVDGHRIWDIVVEGEGVVGDIREGEFVGFTDGKKVQAFNPWKQVKLDRVENREPAIWPEFEYAPNCRNNDVNFVVGSPKATIRVRVYHADQTDQRRLPVVGAEVGLYKNASVIWGPITAGDMLAKGNTNENGIVEFRNVPLSDIMQYFGPLTNNAYLQYFLSQFEKNMEDALYDGTPILDLNELVTKGSTVVLPYLIKQHSAPEGFYFDDVYYPAIIDATDLGRTKFVEIPNYRDNVQGRIAGADRYETAIKIADANYPGGPVNPGGPVTMNDNYKTIILADGHNFADALVGGVLASQYDAPLLLTERAKLTEVTKAYIEKHNVNRVIVLGGEYSVTPAVWKTLNDMGVHVTRVNGANRAATAVKVGENVIKLLNDANHVKFNKGFTHNGRVFLAYEGDFADALTASVPAAEFGTPILLTATNKLSPETAKALIDWKVREVIIVGGPNSVSEAVAEEVRAIGNITVGRYYGLNRATTAMEIAKHFYHQTNFAYVANGTIWADALTGAPLAAKVSAPILLVEKDKVPAEVAKYIQDSNISSITILGGPNTVSNLVREELNRIMVPGAPGIEVSN